MSDQLRDAVSSAAAELNTDAGKDTERSSERTARDVPRETRQDADTHDDDDFGAPKWVKGQWKKDAREALRKLHSYPDANEPLARVYKEIEEKYNDQKSKRAEYDQYRARFSRYENSIPQIEQEFALRGLDPVAGIQQLMSYQQMLQSDPDRGLQLLAQQVKPRDAKAVLQMLTQHWGVDVGQLAQQQEWIDPAVQKLVAPLQQQNQQLMQYLQNQHQMQYQVAANQVGSSIKAFVEAKDENGDPKYPHYQRLEGRMAQMVQMGGIRPLEDLYNEALWQDPELREEAITLRARANAPKVIEDVNRQNAIADQAKRASRNVNGGTRTPTSKPNTDLRDLIRQERKRLEAR